VISNLVLNHSFSHSAANTLLWNCAAGASLTLDNCLVKCDNANSIPNALVINNAFSAASTLVVKNCDFVGPGGATPHSAIVINDIQAVAGPSRSATASSRTGNGASGQPHGQQRQPGLPGFQLHL